MIEKPLAWLGASLDDIHEFPADARRIAGYQLRRVQQGLMPDEHRVVYVAKFDEAIYVLHAFEKRTPQTREADIALARGRLGGLLRARSRPKRNVKGTR